MTFLADNEELADARWDAEARIELILVEYAECAEKYLDPDETDTAIEEDIKVRLDQARSSAMQTYRFHKKYPRGVVS